MFDVLNTKLWLALIAVALAGCAHNTAIAPSQGHIDLEGGQSGQTSVPSAVIPKPVTDSVFVPPPKPRPKEQTYSVVVNEVPVKEILFALARESKLNIDIHPSIQGRVTLNAVDQTLPAILERLARQVDLTYKVDGNVLIIKPDQPVLRTYKVDYVNMSRDTKGYIGAAAEIASTGQAAATGGGSAGGGASSSSSASGNTANNSSRTSVTSESKNHFWETLISNIEDILAETDKEVIITRTTGDNTTETVISTDVDLASPAAVPAPIDPRSAAQRRDEARTEYKTLFAATVIANPEAGVLTIRANSKQHEKVQEFLDKVIASAKRQVLIEATIVEVQLNDTYQAGINWSRLGDGFIFSQTLGPQIATSFGPNAITTNSPGLVAGYTNSDFQAAIQLLRQFGDTKVLSSPKLMVLNNQTAVLKVVDNLVYFTVQAQQSTIGGTVGGILSSITTTPNTVPVGIVMSVTPQISAGGVVNINVRPTISSLIRYVPDPNPNLVAVNNQGIPEIQVREMESLLQISSGNTAVLGGLMQDVVRRDSDNVPGLYKLPLIGKLFTGETDSNAKTELVIFIRPTVIPNASLESDELESFKQFLPAQQLQQTVDEPVN
jgi:MSHA biogenesis protein MshL